MKVLGIHNTGINSSAALIIDGKIKFAILEERLSRKKHDKSFPHKSISKILELCNLNIDDRTWLESQVWVFTRLCSELI